MGQFITESERKIDIVGDYDICVIGGSCTGVFAAVRAARLGKKVCLIEQSNCFGGVATNGLVNVWHKLTDTVNSKQIIAGLTAEVVERLEKRGASRPVGSDSVGFYINSEELKIELDELIVENKIAVRLHCMFVDVKLDGDEIDAVIFEDKSGRAAIKAKMFIDATGDGDVVARSGMDFNIAADLQPPTTCAKIIGMSDIKVGELFQQHHDEFGVGTDHGWAGHVPGSDDILMYALTHCFGTNVADADSLTAAEIEGRRHIRAIMDMVRKYGKEKANPILLTLPARIGSRESRRFNAEYVLTEDDVLTGRSFDDAICYGSYRVDVHHPDGGGFLLKYLDGTQSDCRYGRHEKGRWRDPLPDGQADPTFYQVPLRTMICKTANDGSIKNLLAAGRMIGTDQGAFGAVRVMVNLNQIGEAAGVAASVALDDNCALISVDVKKVRKALVDGGSILFDV